MDAYEKNFRRLTQHGYDRLLIVDLDLFKKRVEQKLDIECPITEGSSKIHDYRAAFGLIFAEEIKGYDFWGHTDFDMVYGRVEQFVTDGFLQDLDIHSNHVDYISGPWTLYRNNAFVNSIFLDHPDWKGILENPRTTGWVETSFTKLVDMYHQIGHINRKYTMWQTQNLNDFSTCHWDGDRLMEGDTEIMYAHFRRTKVYPPNLL